MGDGRRPVDDQGAGQHPQRIQALAGQRDAAHEPDQQPAAGHPDRGADGQLEQELGGDAAGGVQARGRPAASRAIPTGSLAPDSPSRMVPLRPATSRRPSTENITAGSVGASAVPSSNADHQSRSNRAWASTAKAAAVTNVPATPDPDHWEGRAAEAAPADVHPAVEQDDH